MEHVAETVRKLAERWYFDSDDRCDRFFGSYGIKRDLEDLVRYVRNVKRDNREYL